jgi:hypothetical protein
MGYRSDVAYVIKFDDIETRDNFITLMLAKNDKWITQALDECEHGYDEDPIISFNQEGIKWYESYNDVQAHRKLMTEAVEIYKEKGGRYRFIAVGEDGQEEFYEDDDEGDLYEYITTTHAVITYFPSIKVTTEE